MTTIQKIEKLEREATHLKSLFSAIVPLDKEGHYKDSFVQHMKRVAKEKSSEIYKGKGDLLQNRMKLKENRA